MKKNLAVLTALLLVLAVAMPALAAVEFKYGGQFRARWESEDNVYDGTNSLGEFQSANQGTRGTGLLTHHSDDDNRNFIDQRLRLYFSFIASQNLKVVTKFEMGDSTWGDSNPIGASGTSKYSAGGRVGADTTIVELKNAYVEFNIPCTPTTAIVGIQTLTLLDSWIVDDDFSAAVAVTKLDPFKITVGYVGGQSGGLSLAGQTNVENQMVWTDPSRNIDDVFLSLDYKQAPWAASLVFFYQNAHNTAASIDPSTLATPESMWGNVDTGFFPSGLRFFNVGTYTMAIENNQLFDIGLSVSYKIDWLSAYVNFVKNLGSVDGVLWDTASGAPVPNTPKRSMDYVGWMVDAGVSYYCGPYTFNLGGFYTTGPKFDKSRDAADGDWANLLLVDNKDVEWFTYPLATSKYFSEIIGGGVLGDDRYAYRGFADNNIMGMGGAPFRTMYWRGYGFPTNLWTISAGAAWQVAEKTKISASYWYFGTAEEVPVRYNPVSDRYDFSSSIGHELDLYIDQGIVDGLNLTLVGAYLIADDAFCPVPATNSSQYTKNFADNAYEVGARLQWNF